MMSIMEILVIGEGSGNDVIVSGEGSDFNHGDTIEGEVQEMM